MSSNTYTYEKPAFNIGERIAGQMKLTPTEIVAFADMCGDSNPLHHDEALARTTRFGGLIACGAQVSSLMMCLPAGYLTRNHAALALEVSFQFRKAVKADETIEMEWEIVATEPKASLNGEIVTLQGKARNERGEVVLMGMAKVLITSHL